MRERQEKPIDKHPETAPENAVGELMGSVVQLRANNTGLPDTLKSGLEHLSGYAMDDVQVHYNSSKPAQLNAYAYAQGNQIHLGPGQEKHLPHEAWHVVQQKQGRVQPTRQFKGMTAINDDKALEHEADVMGEKAACLGSESVGNIVQRQFMNPLIQPIQRAIGAEIETDLTVYKPDSPTPISGKHGDLIGYIKSKWGEQRVEIDSGTVVEITTLPFERKKQDEVSELPELMKYLSILKDLPPISQEANTRIASSQQSSSSASSVVASSLDSHQAEEKKENPFELVGNKFKGGRLFRKGNSVTGDFQLNISPTDAASVDAYYTAIYGRRDKNEVSVNKTLAQQGRGKLFGNQKLDLVRKTIDFITYKGSSIFTRNVILPKHGQQGKLNEFGEQIEDRATSLFRVMADAIVNVNLRDSDGSTEKNLLDVLPKYNFQDLLSDFCKFANKTPEAEEKKHEEVISKEIIRDTKVELCATLRRAFCESEDEFLKPLLGDNFIQQKAVMMDMIDQLAVSGINQIVKKKDGTEKQQPDSIVNDSSNWISRELAPHGVYEDRVPFEEHLQNISIPVDNWENYVNSYENYLIQSRVNY